MIKLSEAIKVLGHDEFTLVGDNEIILDDGSAVDPADLDLIKRRSKYDFAEPHEVHNHAKMLIAQGGIFTVGGKAVRLSGAPEPASVLQGYAFAAQMRIAQNRTRPVPYIDVAGTMHTLNEYEMLELWAKGSEYISAVLAKEHEFVNMGDIPATFKDPAKWPTI